MAPKKQIKSKNASGNKKEKPSALAIDKTAIKDKAYYSPDNIRKRRGVVRKAYIDKVKDVKVFMTRKEMRKELIKAREAGIFGKKGGWCARASKAIGLEPINGPAYLSVYVSKVKRPERACLMHMLLRTVLNGETEAVLVGRYIWLFLERMRGDKEKTKDRLKREKAHPNGFDLDQADSDSEEDAEDE